MQQEKPLGIGHYRDALEGVVTQFALTRLALSELPESAIKKFFKNRLNDQLEKSTKAFQTLRANDSGLDPKFVEWMEKAQFERLKKKHRKDAKPGDIRFKKEFIEDRLNQSELLLLVAHFESFMKEVHRRFLYAAPAKVFSKKNTKVLLSHVFKGSTQSFSTGFLIGQIEIEVKLLDQQNIVKRADYFKQNFGVEFGRKEDMEELEHIMETRNDITHRIYVNPSPTVETVKELPLVSDEMLKKARRLFSDIPNKCIAAGAEIHQSHFKNI